MKNTTQRIALTCLASALFATPSAQAAARTWAGVGTDFNTTANWTGGVPGTGDVGLFSGTTPPPQPILSASLAIAGLRFAAGTSGYDITSTGGAVLTLNGTSTTGSSGTTTASASAFRNDNTTGITTIDASLILAPSTLIATIFQDANDGSSLVLNGTIGQTGVVALSLKNGTIELNGISTYSGGTTIDAAGTILVLGNNSAIGAGSLTVNNVSTIQAGGSARSISNNTILAADTTIGGNNGLTFNSSGTITGSGSNSRKLIVNNSANTVLAGNVYLAESDSVSRSLTISGTGAVAISGVITNNNAANTLASSLVYGGSNTLTLSNANTYTGNTTVSLGSLLVSGSGSKLGTGNVLVLTTATTLSISTGVTDAISDGATLTLGGGGTIGVADTGYITLGAGVNEIVGGLIFGTNSVQAAGTWGATGSGATNISDEYFSGPGILTVVPEPSSWILLASSLGLALSFRRSRKRLNQINS